MHVTEVYVSEVYDWPMDRSASESQATRTEIDKRLKMTVFFIKKNQHHISLLIVRHTTIQFIQISFHSLYTSHGFKRWQGLIRHNDFPATIYESTLAARQIARTAHTESTLSSNVSDTRIHSTPRAIIDNRMEGRIDCQISSMNIKR